MSHFTVLVITRKKTKEGLNPELEVEKLLSPYNEHDNAPPHPKECFCTSESGKGKPKKDCEYCEGSGVSLSTYNESSKWDWYEIGGRWRGSLLKNMYSSDVEFVRDIRKGFVPFAFVTPDYLWHENAKMGWFAITTDENLEFNEEWESALNTYSDHVAVLVDCHI